MVKIYVANLGAYNAGRLIGEWIDLPLDADELQERLDAILSAADEEGDLFGEELAIHDYEAPFKIEEYTSITSVNEWAERLDALTEDEDVIEAVLGNWVDAEDGLSCLENGEYTVYHNCKYMPDVAYSVAEDNGDIEALDATKINGVGYSAYVDWEAVGRDMSINGTFIGYSGTYDARGTYTGGYVEIHN